ncbi:MAG: hypothetical protein ACOYNI_11830 [Acidimicrobiia bacterium]
MFTVAIALLVAIAIIPSLPLPAMIAAAAMLLVILMRLAQLVRMPDYSNSTELAGEWTTHEFRRLARLGWRIVADVEWNGRTIEHVAVGPAGVLAIRTAIASTAWKLSPTSLDGPADDLLGPTRDDAAVLADLFAAASIDARVVPTLVVWGPGAPLYSNGQEVVDGVAVLIGRQAPEWRVDLRGRNLTDDLLTRIVDLLAPATPGAGHPRGTAGFESSRRRARRALTRA